MNLQTNTGILPVDVRNDVYEQLGATLKSFQHISKGCYADIFLLTLDNDAQCVLKLFRFPGIAERELNSYEFIARYKALPMPKLLCSNADKKYVCMEYIKGCSLSKITAPNDILAADVVECLMKCHRSGMDSSPVEATAYWENEYGKRQAEILSRSRQLVTDGLLEQEVYNVFASSVSALPRVLGNSVQRLSLIHGDYTPWNIMVDPDTNTVVSVLDPYLSCFGDCEYDLMMMNKSNGKDLGLLKQYQEHIPPSLQFSRKIVYYNSWNELCHYYYSDRKLTMNISERAYELRQVIGH